MTSRLVRGRPGSRHSRSALGKLTLPGRSAPPSTSARRSSARCPPYRQDDPAKLHYIAEIPPPPAPWIAHWCSLLGNRRLVGRRGELNLLTDWVARPSSGLYPARLLPLVSIAGMGKSALAWTWWNEIAPNEMK